MKVFILAVALIWGSSLYASEGRSCEYGCDDEGGDIVSVDIDVLSTAEASAVAEQEQTLVAGDSYSEGGNATATSGDASATGGTATTGPVEVNTPVSINYPRERSTKTIYTTPSSRAPTVYPTVNCFKPASLAIGVPWFSASGGRGKIDLGCVERENVRLAPTDAHKIRAWCSLKGIAENWKSLKECVEYGVVDISEPPNPVQEDFFETASTEQEYVERLDRQQQQQQQVSVEQQTVIQDLLRRLRAREEADAIKAASDSRFYEQLEELSKEER